MKFQFDPQKSERTKADRGLSFAEATQLWDDEFLLEIPAKTMEDEHRCLVVGRIHKKHWSCIITYRDDVVRIISLRRSRKKEVEAYESERAR